MLGKLRLKHSTGKDELNTKSWRAKHLESWNIFLILTWGHFFIAFREEGRERNINPREKHGCTAFCLRSDWGWNLQPFGYRTTCQALDTGQGNNEILYINLCNTFYSLDRIFTCIILSNSHYWKVILYMKLKIMLVVQDCRATKHQSFILKLWFHV